MVKSVDEYLRLLRKELAVSDAAVVQDAIADAEEHLRTALAQAVNGNPNTSEAEAIPAIAEKYGSPQEVAAPHTGRWNRAFLWALADLRTWAVNPSSLGSLECSPIPGRGEPFCISFSR